MIGTLAAFSACRGGDAKQADVDALRQELGALKQTQAAMQKTLAALEKAAQPAVPGAVAARPSTTQQDAIHQIPINFAPRKGKKTAVVTVVEFADFQCPYCQRAAGFSDQLLKEFPDDVQFAFKHYPLGRHPKAFDTAKAAWAAQQQNKFWEMHDLIYGGDIEQLSNDVLRGYAQQLGLDMARFDADMISVQAARAVSFDKELGTGIEVAGTPSFFVNGKRVLDASPRGIRKKVAEEIANHKGGAQP